MLGLPLTDLTGGFTCFRAAALRALLRERVASRGYVFQIELPIVFRERDRGESKLSVPIAFEALWRVPLMRLTAPARRVGRRPSHRLSKRTLAG